MLDGTARWAVWLWLGVLAPSQAFAQSAPAKYDAGNEHYAQASLPNGLRVYLADDHRVPADDHEGHSCVAQASQELERGWIQIGLVHAASGGRGIARLRKFSRRYRS